MNLTTEVFLASWTDAFFLSERKGILRLIFERNYKHVNFDIQVVATFKLHFKDDHWIRTL